MVPPRPWRLSPSPGVAEHIAAAVLPGIPQSQPSGAAFPKPCPSPALTLVPAASEVGEQVVVFAFLSWAPAFQPCTVLVTRLPLQHYSTQFLSLPSRLWVVTGSLCHRTVGWLRVPSGLVARRGGRTPLWRMVTRRAVRCEPAVCPCGPFGKALSSHDVYSGVRSRGTDPDALF